MKSIFEFMDYRKFLDQALPTSGASRGIRTQLAEALGCKSGFISQALSGQSDFGLEHALKISKFLKLTGEETEYFLVLIQKARSGTEDLKSFFDKKIRETQDRRKLVSTRIKDKSSLTDADKLKYYSSWIYSAVHMAIMIPEFQSPVNLQKHLSVARPVLMEVLEFLTKAGMAQKKDTKFIGIPTRLHIPADSPLIQQHHANWRLKSFESLSHAQAGELRYSLVMSASPHAYDKMKKILLDAIEKMEPVLKEAPDQSLYTLNIDLFSPLNGHSISNQ